MFAMLVLLVLQFDTRLRPVASAHLMREVCGDQNARVPACTQFVAPELTASCSAASAQWSMRVDARFTALVYVLDHGHVAHELLHIGDIRRDVAWLVEEVERRRYRDEGACRQDAAALASGFRRRMRGFAASSNAVRH